MKLQHLRPPLHEDRENRVTPRKQDIGAATRRDRTVPAGGVIKKPEIFSSQRRNDFLIDILWDVIYYMMLDGWKDCPRHFGRGSKLAFEVWSWKCSFSIDRGAAAGFPGLSGTVSRI